ncbi:hypothetical protein [Brachybacterium endophyticum]|uniref:hypothetical protein n=1 Tax=Brachybacterium endophyticum TaxID=2182385 RepID=UPI00196B4D3F|nr:hypothetical protein [Brachybacterium endophyticum]
MSTALHVRALPGGAAPEADRNEPQETRSDPGKTRDARHERSDPGETHADRLARARAALGAAERSTARHGSRIDRTAFSGGLGGPTGLVRPGTRPTPDTGRQESAAPGSGPAPAPVSVPSPAETSARVPLPPPLAPLVPHGSLRAGSTVAVDGAGSVSLLLAMAASACGDDGWCALAGLPDAGLRAAHDAGLDPERLALVTATDTEAMPQLPQVLSALVDGVGVLVLGPRLRIPPSLRRSLTDRARAHDTLVLTADPSGRADVRMRIEEESWEGLGQGTGRLRRRSLRVRSAGRGIPEGSAIDIVLPEVHGLIAPAPHAAPARPASLHMIRRAG